MNKRIYYSIWDVVDWLTNTREVKQDTGWGRLTTTVNDLLHTIGYNLVTSPDEADIEFYVGQPPFCLRPQMHPAVTLSMFETDRLPKVWTESFNRWDAIINPSNWGRDCFQQSGVNRPIHVIPLPINFDKFKYCKHNASEWTFIAQAVQLLDRKRANLVIEVFQSGKMPSDTMLIVKTTPARSGCEFDMWLNEQIHLIQVSLPFNEYYDLLANSHVSVNPSSGEGFGYLPCLLPDTLVYTNNTIKKISEVNVGDKILTHKGNWKYVKAKSITDCNQEIFEFKVSGCYKPIEITANHIIPVFRPNEKRGLFKQFNRHQLMLFNPKIQWIKTSEITIDDLLLQPRIINNLEGTSSEVDLVSYLPSALFDDEFVWYKMSFTIKPKLSYKDLVEQTGFSYRSLQRVIQGRSGIREELKSRIFSKLNEIGYEFPKPTKFKRFWALNEEFAYILGIYVAEGSYSHGVLEFSIHEYEDNFADSIKEFFKKYCEITFWDDVTQNTHSRRLCLSSMLLGKFFGSICGLGAHNKKIPQFIMNASHNIKSQFLRGLFEGDAYVVNCPGAKQVELCTVSKELAFQTKLLLLSLGLNAQITTSMQRGFLAYFVGVGGSQLIDSDFLEVEWQKSFARQHFFTDVDYYYYHIESITRKHYNGPVYDLQIEDDATFCIDGGYIVHNCESMAVGLCTMMTDYSAMRDLLANDCTIPLKNEIMQTDLFVSGGNDAKVDPDDLLAKMIWTYEYQDEALAMGKRSSEWIRNYCSQNEIVDKLDQIFSYLIDTVPKSVFARKDTDPEDYWIHKESLRRELAWRDEQHSE